MVEYETVGLDSDAMDAARLMAEHQLPTLLVVDEAGGAEGDPAVCAPL
ncbi:hypothetical protein [Streptomyces sp. NBC_01800]|nr:hypothetical protein [Streptomyces sp. NBC_01800]WSA66766.1 hypothetical protein OIE65_07090 [Streptomyces sp. NBC_01800]